MRLSKKDKPTEETQKLTLELGWNNDFAREVYVLYNPSYVKTGNTVVTTKTPIAEGDKEWAKKTAAHYGIPMPGDKK